MESESYPVDPPSPPSQPDPTPVSPQSKPVFVPPTFLDSCILNVRRRWPRQVYPYSIPWANHFSKLENPAVGPGEPCVKFPEPPKLPLKSLDPDFFYEKGQRQQSGILPPKQHPQPGALEEKSTKEKIRVKRRPLKELSNLNDKVLSPVVQADLKPVITILKRERKEEKGPSSENTTRASQLPESKTRNFSRKLHLSPKQTLERSASPDQNTEPPVAQSHEPLNASPSPDTVSLITPSIEPPRNVSPSPSTETHITKPNKPLKPSVSPRKYHPIPRSKLSSSRSRQRSHSF